MSKELLVDHEKLENDKKVINAKKEIKQRFQNHLNKCSSEFYNIYELIKNDNVSCVYFITNKLNGYTKIGKTKNLKQRLNQIKNEVRNSAQSDIEIDRVILCPVSQLTPLEAMMHKFYKKHRKNGEWFDIKEYEDDFYVCDAFIDGPGVSVDFLFNILNKIDLKRNFYSHMCPGMYALFGVNSAETYIAAMCRNIRESYIFEIDDFLSKNNFLLKITNYDQNDGVFYTKSMGVVDGEEVYLTDAYFKKVQSLYQILI